MQNDSYPFIIELFCCFILLFLSAKIVFTGNVPFLSRNNILNSTFKNKTAFTGVQITLTDKKKDSELAIVFYCTSVWCLLLFYNYYKPFRLRIVMTLPSISSLFTTPKYRESSPPFLLSAITKYWSFSNLIGYSVKPS